MQAASHAHQKHDSTRKSDAFTRIATEPPRRLKVTTSRGRTIEALQRDAERRRDLLAGPIHPLGSSTGGQRRPTTRTPPENLDHTG